MILGTRPSERPTIGLEALPTIESFNRAIRWFLQAVTSLVGFWSLGRSFGSKQRFLAVFSL